MFSDRPAGGTLTLVLLRPSHSGVIQGLHQVDPPLSEDKGLPILIIHIPNEPIRLLNNMDALIHAG